MERIWRREGLKVPQKQPKRGRLWLNDGSCVRLRPQRANHVWAYDFVMLRTQDSRAVRLLTVMDEYTRECLAIRADRHIRSSDVIETLAQLMAGRGVPEQIRSDNGPEFTARAIRQWLGRVGARTLYIEPGSPWENGYIESFNGKLRDELLARELFYTKLAVRVLTERYRQTYNRIRPHSSLGFRPPVPETVMTAGAVPMVVLTPKAGPGGELVLWDDQRREGGSFHEEFPLYGGAGGFCSQAGGGGGRRWGRSAGRWVLPSRPSTGGRRGTSAWEWRR